MKNSQILTFATVTLLACGLTKAQSDASKDAGKVELLLASEVQWEKLNPARGDQSPQAGTLWGDRSSADHTYDASKHDCPICSQGPHTGPVPTGFLAKFVDGFSSPPHIHNVTYRAVVISGLVHNDDPDAAHMWMPPGSFWTQPKGEVHITAAQGEEVVALVEIDQGPYLVMPPEEAFDSGERPVNVDASNLVWVDPVGFTPSPNGPKIAYLWGSLEDGHSNGTFIKLPAGFEGALQSSGDTFRAVVISGEIQYSDSRKPVLSPGSYIGSSGETVHAFANESSEDSVLYIRTNAKYSLAPSEI